MPHKGRASGNCPERNDKELDRSGVACAAGQAHGFPLRFAIDCPGRFTVYRGEVRIGGIDFKPGGWIAYEMIAGRPRWTPHGRIMARFAAYDCWGETASRQVGLMDENRPSHSPPHDGASLRRDIQRGKNNAATP